MALSRDDLMRIFLASVDPDFAADLLSDATSAATIEASAEVFAKSSEAIERTSQSMFLRRWSGQTYEPATGARLARVTLELSRRAPADRELVLLPGVFYVEQVETDFGEDGGVEVGTGRLYTPEAIVCFVPGQSTLSAPFLSQRPGMAYNLPAPGTITRPIDSGTVAGSGATVEPGSNAHRLVLAPEGETVAPSSIGQYVLFNSGANAGQRRRIIGYEQPDPNAPHNGVVTLAPTLVLEIVVVSGTFQPGETIEQSSSGATAKLIVTDGVIYLVADRQAAPAFVVGGNVMGLASGAVASVLSIPVSPDMTAEVGIAGWELLDWSNGVGLSVTNSESPVDGASPTLDHIGEETDLGRTSGESDEAYRGRLENRPDVVSPNALKRAMNRVLAPYGLTGCLREPSYLDTFEGFFYDAPANGPPERRYAYDFDFAVRPADRYKLMLDLAEFRAFFVAAIPPMSLGEFGFAYDQGFVNAYDSAPFLSFYDGFPVTAATLRLAVWNALNATREAGVGFVLVEDRYGC